jgi:hypothetical protein
MLAGSIALSQPSWAADECGTGTSITCTLRGNNYTSGITYSPVADLTMVVEDGVNIATSSSHGIQILFSNPFGVDLTINDSDITTTGNSQNGIFVSKRSIMMPPLSIGICRHRPNRPGF